VHLSFVNSDVAVSFFPFLQRDKESERSKHADKDKGSEEAEGLQVLVVTASGAGCRCQFLSLAHHAFTSGESSVSMRSTGRTFCHGLYHLVKV